ncbi:MAG: phage major capsid protein [Muribaculaceae bacterium]|nr:phage major capsid protein [Muribaculaceae bacterium]
MANNVNIITRSNAEALIPTQVANEIISGVTESANILRLMRRLPNMTAKQYKMPVLSALPMAYFVDGDTGQKQTTKAEWDNITLTAEEIACIVPIPEAVLADASYDIFAQIKPLIVSAFNDVIQKAILAGENIPMSWGQAIVPAAIAAGNVVTRGTNEDIAGDIIGENGVMAQVENDGFNVNGFFADNTLKPVLRNLRNTNNTPIYVNSVATGSPSTLLGIPVNYNNTGVFDTSKALMLAGDFTKAVYSIREDLTYKVLTEAVIQNPDGTIAYNLAQQDMVALRCVMRLGVAVANPLTKSNGDATTRYPFAVLAPAATKAAAKKSE